MTGIPIASGEVAAREWSIDHRTLVLSASGNRVLATLNTRYPLLLPAGSVLQFDDPPGELVVTGTRVILGDATGIVCAEAEPAPTLEHHRAAAAGEHLADGRRVPAPGIDGLPPRCSRIRPGNG